MKLLLAVCLALLPLAAQAQAPGTVRWVRFTDPTDQAFSVDVPAGWTVVGGIAHRSAADVSWFVSAVSPDGAITLRIGDPQIGVVAVAPAATPAQTAPATTQAKAPARGGPLAALTADRPYETGAEFAAHYGRNVVSQLRLCGNPKLLGPQAEPDPPGFTAQLGRQVTTGDVFLLCIDRAYVGYVVATTVLAAPPVERWTAPWLAALAAPVDRRAEAMSLLRHMEDSWSFTPAWLQKMSGADGPLARPLAALREPSPAGDRARWYAGLDAADAAALHKIDKLMGNATELCPADGKMPAPHACGESGHPPGK